MTLTQNERIVNFLSRKGATLTAAQAESRFGVANLRARISELRDRGFDIRTDFKFARGSNSPVAVYTMGM